MTSAVVANPYVGPRTFSYEQRNVFFGREREARDLLARVLSERLLLFYAQSGAGKSSLLNTRLIPQLQEEKGFVVLNWGDAGWIHFFTKTPVVAPEEAKALKLFLSTSGGDPTLLQLYKETGFHPVPLSVNDLLPGLQTGMVNGYNATPLVSLAFQWFGLAPHMADLRWAPLTGATVIEKKAWEKIPADLRGKLLEASRDAGRKLHDEVRRLNQEAIGVMVKNGLKIHKVPPDVQAQWRRMVEDIHPRVRGGIMPAEAFDAVKKYRDEYRAGKGGPR